MLPFISLSAFTTFHTALSLIAIIAGALALRTLSGYKAAPHAIPIFLALAFATSLTGFLFPFHGPTPAIITGVVALVVLAVTYLAKECFHLTGRWNLVYRLGMVASEYLLVFVLVAQAFLKVPSLHALAPTGSEPPFAVAQLVVLAAFIAIGVKIARKRPAKKSPAKKSPTKSRRK